MILETASIDVVSGHAILDRLRLMLQGRQSIARETAIKAGL
jgi:hypothetical protein